MFSRSPPITKYQKRLLKGLTAEGEGASILNRSDFRGSRLNETGSLAAPPVKWAHLSDWSCPRGGLRSVKYRWGNCSRLTAEKLDFQFIPITGSEREFFRES